MTPRITVDHEQADTFVIDVRGHRVTIDQPVTDGGSDAGPTPTELFVVSVAGCVAHYARRYLARHDLPQSGLRVIADYELAARPARVGQIRLVLEVPAGTRRNDTPRSWRSPPTAPCTTASRTRRRWASSSAR